MIRFLLDTQDVHALSRPSDPTGHFWTIKEIPDVKSLFGVGNQNIINAASSMLKDTPHLPERLQELVDENIDIKSYLLKYVKEDNAEQVPQMLAKNLIRFKEDLKLRRAVLPQIIGSEPRSFKKDIYPGFFFIVLALYFTYNHTLFSPQSRYRREILNYFNSEEELIDRVNEALYDASVIENLNSFCHGRYFFIDFRLSDYLDHKPIAITSVEMLIKSVV